MSLTNKLLTPFLIVALASVIVSLNAPLVLAQPPNDPNPTPNPIVTPFAGFTQITVSDADGLNWVEAWWNVFPFQVIHDARNPANPDTFNAPALGAWPAQGLMVKVVDNIGWVSIFHITPALAITRIAYFWGGEVGGIVIAVDKFALLAPYIGLASTILVATVATAVYVKRVKRRKEKQ